MQNDQNGNGLVRVSTGIESLDAIVSGGLPKGEMYVVNGAPGTGKTILALHFLKAGVDAGERALCIALSQRVKSLHQTGASVGIDTRCILFRELTDKQSLQVSFGQQTVFDTSEIDLEDTISSFTQVIEEIQPHRIVFDGISYLRMLANNPVTYRRYVLTLRDYMARHNITVMLTDTQNLGPGDHELASIAHGVLALSSAPSGFGLDHRYLQVIKIRGSDFNRGVHDMEISNQGMCVYPLYHQFNSNRPLSEQLMTSGISELDNLLGGGLASGTSCLVIGPSGTGKSSIATLFANQLIQEGGKVSVFLFDELRKTFLRRSQRFGMMFDPDTMPNHLRIHEIGLASITPGNFAHLVQKDVDNWGAGIVIIDSLTGYTNLMSDTKRLITQMHELLISLNRQNVLTILVVAQHGVIGANIGQHLDISYLSDTVLLLRHFEAKGFLHRAISVYKKRYGSHENSIREVQLTSGRIKIGQTLEQFVGILSGIPNYSGTIHREA